MNIQNQIHEKVYNIRIYNTTDNFDSSVGSGVANLHVYVQATPTLAEADDRFITPNFNNATLVGILRNVDSRPSYATSSKPLPTTLTLRDANGIPFGHELFNGVPQHGPDNLYPFEFNNYINGHYYYIWVLAEDKAGNLELINSDSDVFGKNTLTIPLITTSILTDTVASEFNLTEFIGETATLSGGRYLIPLPNYIDSGNFESWFNNRNILRFEIASTIHYRYITDAIYSSGNLSITLNDQGTISGSLTNLYLVPEVIASANIGSITLDIPESDSVNLAGYLVELISEESPINVVDDGNATYEYISAITYNNKYTDVGLVFSKEDFTDSGQQFLYKVTPISKYTTDGMFMAADYSNALKGIPSFSFGTNFEDLYYPSSGFIPAALILEYADDGTGWFDTSSNNGSIVLKWCKTTGDGAQAEATLDANNDLRGYVIQRMKRRKVGAGAWEESNWEDIIYTDKEDFLPTTGFDRSYIDSNLEKYNSTSEPDTTSSNYILINYKYRIAAFDYGGNQSVWSVFNNDTAINITDSTPPDTADYTLEVLGKIGGWYIEFLDASQTTVEIQVKKQRTDLNGDTLFGYSEEFIGNNISVGLDGKAIIADTSAPDNEVRYAKFNVRGRDNNGNWTNWLGWTDHYSSKTPDMVMDNWAPKPPIDVVATFDEALGKVNITWVKPTLEQLLSTQNINSVVSTTITSDVILGADNYFVVNGAYVKIIETGTTGVITANSGYDITVSSWSGVAPTDANTFEIVRTLNDGDGFIIFKRLAAEADNWVLVRDTDSWGTTSYNDYALTTGDWRYGVAAYDLSGNESAIVEYATTLEIADTTAPDYPVLQNTLGGVGLIQFQWNITSDDTAEFIVYIKDKDSKYVLDSNGEFISNPASRPLSPAIPIANHAHTLINSLSIYDVTDTIEDIKLWTVGIVAIDTFGNASTLNYTTVTNVWGKYEPAEQAEPPALQSGWLTTDVTAKDGSITFTFSSSIDRRIGAIYIERDVKLNGGSYSGTYVYVDTEVISDAEYNGLKFTHRNLGNKIYKYRFRPVSKFGNIGELGTESVPVSEIYSLDINVTDFAGPGNLNTIASFRDNCSAYPESGFINIKFDDVFDDKLVKYEIWRTPYRYFTGSTRWSVSNFFDASKDTYGRTKVYTGTNVGWERLTTIYSTLSNVSGKDNYRYQDNDWTMDGKIPYSTGSDSKTKFSAGYDGYATYAIVPLDEFDNRSYPYFVGATAGQGMIASSYTEAADNAWISAINAKDYMVSVVLQQPEGIKDIVYGLNGVRKSPTASTFDIIADANIVQYLPNLYAVWVYKNDSGSNVLIKEGLWTTLANQSHTITTADFDSSSIVTGRIYTIYLYKDSTFYGGLGSIETNKLAKSAIGFRKTNEISNYWVQLPNSSHTIVVDNSNTPIAGEIGSSGRAKTLVTAGYGSLNYTYTSLDDTSNPAFTSSMFAITNISVAGTGWAATEATGEVYISTVGTTDVANITITVKFKDNTTVTSVFSVNKNKGISVDLSSSRYIISYDTSSLIKTESYEDIVFTATTIGNITPASYAWYRAADTASYSLISAEESVFSPGTPTGNTITLYRDAFNLTTELFTTQLKIKVVALDSLGATLDYDEIIIIKVRDGSVGATGAGIVYRGNYSSSSIEYVSNSTRKDIVKYSTNTTNPYWIAKSTFTSSGATTPPASGSTGNTYWDAFGATFSSIATGLLLAEDAAIGKILTIGTTESPGIIQSAGVTGLYTHTSGLHSGFYLYSNPVTDIQYFRIGTTNETDLTSGLLWNDSSLTIRGNLYSTVGTIGGWTLGAKTFSANNVSINSDGYITLGSATAFGTGDGIFLGVDSAAYKFRAGKIGKQRIEWDSADLKIYDKDNAIVFSSSDASVANLAGWNINATEIYKTNAKLSSTGYISFGTTPPTSFGDIEGIYLGYTDSASKFSLYKDINNYLQWDGSVLDIAAQNMEARGTLSIIDNESNKIVIDGDNIHFLSYNLGWNNGFKIKSFSSSGYDSIYFNYVDTNVNVVSIHNAGGGPSGYTFEILNGESSYFGDSITINGNILPNTTDLYDLGSSSVWWSQGYVSTLKAAILAKSEIIVFGGWQLITKDAGKIPVNVLAIANLLDFGKTMTTGDIVYFRKAGQVEYMQVGAQYSGTTYYITRAYQGFGTASAWSKGDTFAVLGASSKARIELYAETDTRISLWQLGASGSELSAQKEIVRIGNLKDSFGYGSSDIYGFAVGDIASNKFITYDPANGLVIKGDITANSGTFNGTVNATGGRFGSATNYWNISATGINAVSSDGDVVIRYGKTDFGADTLSGFILGYDVSAAKSKFEIGTTAAGILKYADGSLSMTGGTITSGLFQTTNVNTLTSATIVIDGSANELSFRKANRTLASDKVLTITSSAYGGQPGLIVNDGTIVLLGPDIIYGGVTNNSLIQLRPEQLRVINFDLQLAAQIQTSIVGSANGITVETNSTSGLGSTSKAIYAKAIGGLTANYGIHSEAISAAAVNYGIYATALNASSVNYGVLGYSTIADNNFGIFSNGHLGIGNGSLGIGGSGSTLSSSKFIVDNNGNITKWNNVAVPAPGATAGYLYWNGSTAWQWAAGGGSGVSTVGTIDSQTKSANGLVISTVNIYAQTADATYPGLVSTGAQTFSGAKTFGSGIVYFGVGTDAESQLFLYNSANNKYTKLLSAEPSVDITVTFPSTTGTLALTSDLTSFITASSTNTLTNKTWQGVAIGDSYISSATTWNAKQTGHANLTSLSGLTYSSASFVKMTAAGTFSLDTNSYIQTGATFGGQVSGTYNNITVTNDGHSHTGSTISGLSASDFTSAAISQWSNDSGYITASNAVTLTNKIWNGFAIADSYISSATTWNAKQTGHANLTSLSSLTYSSASFVKMTAAGTFTLDTNSYLSASSSFGGDVSGTYNNISLSIVSISKGGTGHNGTYFSAGGYFLYYDNVNNRIASSGYSSSSFLTASSTNTLTNKTWNGVAISSSYIDKSTAFSWTNDHDWTKSNDGSYYLILSNTSSGTSALGGLYIKSYQSGSQAGAVLQVFSSAYTNIAGVAGYARFRTDNSLNGWIFDTGNSNASYKFKMSNTDMMTLNSSGDMWIAGEYSFSSDIRLKTNIEKIDSPLAKIMFMNGFYYTRIGDTKNTKLIGLSAQDALQSIPEVVKINPNGFYSVSYSSIIPVLIEAIKEQQIQITELKNKLNID